MFHRFRNFGTNDSAVGISVETIKEIVDYLTLFGSILMAFKWVGFRCGFSLLYFCVSRLGDFKKGNGHFFEGLVAPGYRYIGVRVEGIVG